MTVGIIGHQVKGVGMSIFSEPKQLKKWAIQLANACGGQTVEKTLIVKPLDMKKLNSLLDEFVISFDETIKSRDANAEEE
jgi:hypothetical protein